MIAAGAQEGQHSWLDKFAQAIAEAVVAELKRAQTSTTVTTGSSAGTYTGIVQ